MILVYICDTVYIIEAAQMSKGCHFDVESTDGAMCCDQETWNCD